MKGNAQSALACWLWFGAVMVLSLLPLSTSRMYSWPWYALWQVLLAIPPLVLGVRLLTAREPARRFGCLVDAGILLGLTGFAASALAGIHPGLGMGLLSTPLALAACAYLLLNRELAGAEDKDGTRGAELGTLATLAAAAFVCVALLPPLGTATERLLQFAKGGVLPNFARNDAPFGHSLYTGGMAVLALPLLALRALESQGRRRLLWLLLSAGACIIIFTTKSRAAVLGLSVGGVAALAATWLIRKPSRKQVLVTAGLALAALLAALLLDPRLSVLVRTGRWSASATESNLQRAAMTEVGLRMGLERPLLGQGPGSVPVCYPRMQAGLPGAVPTVLELHSTPVQLWAELGAAGVASALLILAGTGLALARLLRNRGNNTQAWPVAALVYASFGYAVVAWTDFQLDVPLIGLLLAALLVAIHAEAVRRAGGSSAGSDTANLVWSGRSARLAGVAFLLLAGLSLWAQVREVRARGHFAAAASEREAGDPAAYVAGCRQAMAIDPQNPYYPTQLAQAVSGQGMPGESAQPSVARTLLRRALEVYPEFDYAHYNLGWLLLLEDPAEASRHLHAAARIAPNKSRVYLGLGIALLNQGCKEAAVRAFALEFLNNPRSISLPLWDNEAMRGMREMALEEQSRLMGALLSSPACPPDLQGRLGYDLTLARWWLSGSPALLTELETKGNPAQAASWKARSKEPAAAAKLHTHLTARIDSAPDLAAGVTQRRSSFNLLMRNHDGWAPADMESLPERKRVLDEAGTLFNPVGAIPAAFLLQELDRLDVAHQD